MFSRFGIASKGFVYVVMGILVGFAALNMGGEIAGSKDVLTYISQKPFGKVLLLILASGLFSFVFWLIYQTIKDPKRFGNDLRGWADRIGLAFGGVFYGLLGIAALKLVLDGNVKSGTLWVSKFLTSENGSFYTIVLGIILFGKALFEFYLAFSNKFRTDVNPKEIDKNVRKTLINWGRFGFSARALVFATLGFLTLRQGLSRRANLLNTKSDAFSFIDYKFGSLSLWLIALGLVGYGVFMFVKSKHEKLHIKD